MTLYLFMFLLCWLLGTSVLRKAWILRTDVPRSQHRTRIIKS